MKTNCFDKVNKTSSVFNCSLKITHILKKCVWTNKFKIQVIRELMQLPAPKIILYEENTKVVLFSELPFVNISSEDKLWACYLHACLKQITHEGLTNSSLRQRFGLEATSSASISRLIKEAVNAGLIKPFDSETSQRYMKYIPFWG